jgi:uncharacterized protein YlxW (UPF0749 family)
MSLLTDLMAHSLDAGYAEAHARRRPGEEQHRRGRPRLLLLVGVLAVGLLLATSAAQTRNRASAVAQERDAIAGEIAGRAAQNDRLATALERERARLNTSRRDALRLSDEGQRLTRTLTTLEAATGATAVRGPALVVQLDDARSADAPGADVDPRSGQVADGRVTDRDLQTVVNQLWEAGAEAVAVNGQRLTALSAIRSAGDAVLVDFRPLSPPYEVVAVGDAPHVRTAFAEGFGGSYLQALRDYGISYSITTRDSVRLAASAGATLRYASAPSGTESGS